MKNQLIILFALSFITNIILTIIGTKKCGYLNPFCVIVCLLFPMGTLILSIVTLVDIVDEKMKKKIGY